MSDKLKPLPKVKGLFADGNIFAIGGKAAAVLRHKGQGDAASVMIGRVIKAKSYPEAISIIQEYVRP